MRTEFFGLDRPVPKQHSSGGKDKLGSISKQGDRYLRSRPGPAGLDGPALAEPARSSAGRSTRDHSSLASCRFHGVLALEVAEADRAAKDRSRVARAHPTDEQGKPKVGSISDPRRAVDARL